ncbi:MAG TPA: DUF177 domain-containing protein [Nitriliruptorales bacterium]
MKLDLTRFQRPVDHVARTFAPDEMPAATDGAFRVVAPVALTMDVHRERSRFRLVGGVTTGLELACSRCLEPYGLPVEARFDLRYMPEPDAATTGDHEVADGDVDTSVYTDDEIDVHALLQEQFYLALPMKPLCQDGCRGLCVQCGTNLNEGTCECSGAWEDPRLAPLRELGRTRDA